PMGARHTRRVKIMAAVALAFGISIGCVQNTAAQVVPPTNCNGCWVPPQVISWQLQLQGTLDPSVAAEMYDIDLFDNAAAAVSALQAAGRHVVCSLDAGTFEPWRPDASSFPSSVMGKPVAGFSNERWLDIRRLDVLGPIIAARLDLCVAKGFDGA